MEKMYVISSGSYSSYQVHCVCPTKEDAEEIVAKANIDRSDYSKYGVEELAVFDRTVERVVVLRLEIDIQDSDTEHDACEMTTVLWPFDSFDEVSPVAWRWSRRFVHGEKGGRLEVWGADHERVRKTYGEMRVRLHYDAALRMAPEAHR